MIPLRPIISVSTGPIFTKFSSNGRYLIVDYRSDSLLPITQGTLLSQSILGKIGLNTFIRRSGISK